MKQPTRDIVRWGGTRLSGRDISADLQKLTDGVMMGISKTIQVELKATANAVANSQSKSAELDLTGVRRVTIFIDHGRRVANAFVGAGTEYRVEVSQKAAGDDTWRPVGGTGTVAAAITAASTIAVDGEEAAGQTRIETGATLPAAGDIVYMRGAQLTDSEWVKVTRVDNTGGAEYFDILEALTKAHAAGNYFNKGEHFVISLDVSSYTRLRVICNNNNGTTNQSIDWRCAAITQS